MLPVAVSTNRRIRFPPRSQLAVNALPVVVQDRLVTLPTRDRDGEVIDRRQGVAGGKEAMRRPTRRVAVVTRRGLVAASSPYRLVDGGSLTAQVNAVFDPINNKWVTENEGAPPDIEVFMDARSVADGRDPQLERAVQEALRLVDEQGTMNVTPPPFSKPSKRPGGR